jgi:hypothetical protein
MTKNQFAPGHIKPHTSSPIFTVDSSGYIAPTATQNMSPNDTLLIHADPASTTPYGGYVCAWRNNQCQCAVLISNLGGEPHMEISSSAYSIRSDAPTGAAFTLYATLSETGGGPGTSDPNATNGHIYV